MATANDEQLLGLSGRTIIVVGAGGGGIGTGICEMLLRAGARVVGVDRSEEALSLAPSGEDFVPFVADATRSSEVDAAVAEAGETLHGLVSVVGGLPLARWQPLLRYSDEDLDEVMDVNLRSAFRTSLAVARALTSRGRGGSIAHIASISALQGMPFGAAYSMAKSALLSLIRTMALEWGPLGIRANAVAPGTIRVPRQHGGEDPERDARAIPLGRRGAPEDIAGAVLFLLSDLSRWVTGQVLPVDGGVSVKPAYLDEMGLPVFVDDAALKARLQEG